MTYFVISDIHGYYKAMRQSLQKAGYNENNPHHHLIVIGDMFDRGPSSDQVLEYLYPLFQENKASIIIGNHDTFLRDFLQGDNSRVLFNVMYNGFQATLEALSNTSFTEDSLDSIRTKIHRRYPYLQSLLENVPYFIEKGDYIFVHGGIDGGALDWRTMLSEHDYVWSREHQLPPIPGKTVVAGHTRVATIRKRTTSYELLFLHHPEYFDILYMEGKILIDRFVEVAQELNVLVLDM
ncbi:metallophosphoesterase [Candidatus Xianfuyuplasma coldseepsis]|uniref:Fructose-bisphosphatase class III n=1 Tax=Candidatus Xianfuyuplasma coldseepsis TaxID=2782163 RepID=A0A7L7KS64_9MOLU|nr:metallophosphoesterase [Xianfuyuplasma coldseepsis]QMS85046.1 fructose-bisphosphatase class III [Xianfuyuplasma coldseepsis]